MTRLFFDLCPGPIVGITGSSGKTTVTSLVAAAFAAAGKEHVVGGNIGVGLLSLLDEIGPQTWVVLEVSHTQLELTTRSPHVACVLNVTPNHLDRYSWESYVDLKRNILRYQTPDDIAVLGYDNEVSRSLATEARGRVVFFSDGVDLPGPAALLRDDDSGLARRRKGHAGRFDEGDPAEGPAQRVERAGSDGYRVGLWHLGRRDWERRSAASSRCRTAWSSSRKSTASPITTTASRRRRNGLSPESVRSKSRSSCCWAAGKSTCRWTTCSANSAGDVERSCSSARQGRRWWRRRGRRSPVSTRRSVRTSSSSMTLEDAVPVARAAARPGDVVLLSPACTSFDAYDNFEERGEHFRRLVLAMTSVEGGSRP